MYNSALPTTLHLEVTSKCNASCPMCARNVLGSKVNPQLPLTELSLVDIKSFFSLDLVRRLSRIYLCGNYGDPIVAQDTLEILKYFRDAHPKLRLEIFTNGSARSEDWWRELAQVVDLCHFSIDGLGDVNAIYRRGTQWDRIERNVQAFTEQGRAVWDFIVFRHNEHQIEEVQNVAKRWRIQKVNFKKTARFFSNTKMEGKERQPVLNSSGETLYHLEKPLDPRWRNHALEDEADIIKNFGSLKSFLESSPISCRVEQEKSIYVSAEGLVFPCCWTAGQLYVWYLKPQSSPLWTLIQQLPDGLLSLSLKHKSFDDILNGQFFQEVLPASWKRPTFNDGKLFMCAKICGQKYDPFTKQFQ